MIQQRKVKRGEKVKVNINKVAGYRAFLGMTQKEVAEYLKISTQSYSNKENGKRTFKDNEKVKLKILFNQVDPNLTIDKIFF